MESVKKDLHKWSLGKVFVLLWALLSAGTMAQAAPLYEVSMGGDPASGYTGDSVVITLSGIHLDLIVELISEEPVWNILTVDAADQSRSFYCNVRRSFRASFGTHFINGILGAS